MEFFYVAKATQKSGKPDAVVWFTAKTEARANLQLDVYLEDASIETGRGQDYNKPIRTDFPVYNDLPEEGEVDFTWCERYALQEDGHTWLPKAVPTPTPSPATGTTNNPDIPEGVRVENGLTINKNDDESTYYAVVQMPFRKQLLAQLTAEKLRHHITRGEHAAITALEMDTDNSYVQNLLLTAENCPELKKFDTAGLWKYTSAIKKVFDQAKRHELSLVLKFTKTWLATEYIDRGILVREWAAGNRITTVNQKPEAPKSERYTRAVPQSTAGLRNEIAIAQLYPDAEPGKISRAQLTGAKGLQERAEAVFTTATKTLIGISDILEYDTQTIFGITRAIKWNGEGPVKELRQQARIWLADNGIYENGEQSKGYSEWAAEARDSLAKEAEPTCEDVNKTLAAGRGEFVQGISDPTDPKLVHEDLAKTQQPEFTNQGNGIFSVEGLMASSKLYGNNSETTSNVQMEENEHAENKDGAAVSAGEGVVEDDPQANTVTEVVCTGCGAVGGGHCPDCGAVVGDSTYAAMEAGLKEELDAQEATAPTTCEDAITEEEPRAEYPAYFEPGRYEGLPNEVYHSANGISSTQVKDARVSLMYFEARHVTKSITKERSPVLDMGNLVHALALQPDQMDAEFSVEPEVPEGAFTTTATIRAFIDEHNASLPVLLSADAIKALLEEYNATLPAQVPLGASLEETGQSYMMLPEEYQRIEDGQKQTAAAMKACIKEYNATLPAQVKTSGSRDALLELLATINPDLVAQEAQKQQPLKVSGTKADLIQAVKSVNPDAAFADELLDAWRENPEGKVLVTRQQLSTALAIQKALLNHPTAGKLLTHPSRAVEVSYFGFDDETGLEVRVRPDLEIDLEGVRIGADLKTISMWNVKQEGLRGRLHREIIDRDYHLSAAMYSETAALDQFFWIFVNKDENYHWIAIIEASSELLELGMLEYRKAMRAIANGFDTGVWPAPITEDYAEELNDFDMRRLEALRLA